MYNTERIQFTLVLPPPFKTIVNFGDNRGWQYIEGKLTCKLHHSWKFGLEIPRR
jgi:hypothetical protein